jgi:hypothetical protein
MRQRHFIRHPSTIPVEASVSDREDLLRLSMRDISVGGLAFESHHSFAEGAIITIRIPDIDPSFSIHCRVAWIKQTESAYFTGVNFIDGNDAFRIHMVEQACHIQSYWMSASDNGRDISIDEAASEWITFHAAEFSEHSSKAF